MKDPRESVLQTELLQAELATLLKDLHRVADVLADSVAAAPGKIRHTYSEAAEFAGRFEEPVRKHVQAAEHAVEETVRERPLASVLLAFLAGLVVWALVWR